MPDERPDSADEELAIKPVSFDELVESIGHELDTETSQLLLAAWDAASLDSEVSKQLGEPNGN